jgi:hypothetical protein
MLPIPDPCGRFGKLLSLTTAAASAANSFTGDTVVHARDETGKAILKPIREIRIGDEVLAWDEAALVDGQLSQAKPIKLNTTKENTNTKTTRYEKVAGVVTSELQQKLVHITLNNGKTITATQGHPFRTEEGWRDAILLKRGGKLLLKGSGDSEDGSASTQQPRTITIENVQVETKTIRVFNLEVNNLHTFFVGDDGVVVHNGFGSYTCYFKSGKKYHGKGDRKRSELSGKEKANKYNDPVVSIDWTSAKNNRQSFKDEHNRMMTDPQGHKSDNNYNKIASPGRRY